MRVASYPSSSLGPNTRLSAIAAVVAIAALQGCGVQRAESREPAPAQAAAPEPNAVQAVAVHASVSDLAFGADGTLWAVSREGIGRVDARGRVMDARGKVTAGALAPGAATVLAFSPPGDRASLVPRAGGRARWTIKVPPTRFEEPRATWSADGRRLLLETDGPLRVLRATDGRQLRAFRGPVTYVGRTPLSPDGRSVVVEDRRGIAIVDVASGERRVIDAGGSVNRPTWSPDGLRVAGASPRGAVTIVDIATGEVRRLTAHAGGELAWSPDGGELAAYGVQVDGGDPDASGVAIVDAATGEARIIARAGAEEERGELAWSADGRRVAYASAAP